MYQGGSLSMALQFGCQTYTWQMCYEKYSNQLENILNVVQSAGFSGIEPEVCMLGSYRNDPLMLKEDLQARSLQMGALTLALEWRHLTETKEELEEAEFVFNFLKHFPDTLLVLVQLPHLDRSNLAEKQNNALSCINEVAKRASSRGIACAFHPNSPSGSVFRTESDYAAMFDGLDSRYVGYVPDTGHIVNGGMDPLKIIQSVRPIINHVHFKDITEDKQWTAMGEGIINHPAIVQYLKNTDYNGWIMIEEESHQAELEPDHVTLLNGQYTKVKLL
jgi:inosose dehydratase